jgi:hypothetical protein
MAANKDRNGSLRCLNDRKRMMRVPGIRNHASRCTSLIWYYTLNCKALCQQAVGRGGTMNYRHSIVFFIATMAVIAVCLFPPYYLDSGLIGGSVYIFISNPPPPEDQPSLDLWVVQCEIAFIIVSICSALLALRSNSERRQRLTFMIGFTLEVLFFGCSFPSFGTILAIEFTWYTLNASSLFVVFAILLQLIKQAMMSQRDKPH